MARTFKPRDAVSIPRLDATAAVGLALLLIGAAEPETPPGKPPPPPLPEPVAEALADVKADTKSLEIEIAALGDIPGVRAADRAEDNAFAALRDWLAAWARLPPGHEAGDSARALLGRLFPDGLDFVRFPVPKQRAAAGAKLGVIESEDLTPAIEKLGGAPILEHLLVTHAAYSKAIDNAKAAPIELPAIREKLDRLLDALQIYAIRVMASVKRDDPLTHKRAEDLLRPLLEWDRSPPAKSPPGGGSPS